MAYNIHTTNAIITSAPAYEMKTLGNGNKRISHIHMWPSLTNSIRNWSQILNWNNMSSFKYDIWLQLLTQKGNYPNKYLNQETWFFLNCSLGTILSPQVWSQICYFLKPQTPPNGQKHVVYIVENYFLAY